MNQMMKTTTSHDIATLLKFPEIGEILSGNKVTDTDIKYKDGVFRYRITLPKGVRRSDIPNILREFYNIGMFTLNGEDHVVENHDYQTRTTRNNVVVIGSMQVTPVSLTNPVLKKMTALEDFNNEYDKMVMTSPETYFKAFPYRGFNGPAFRSKLFSFVSNMGENYGYCDDKTIYHRRASLVMPKIKITKAPEQAKMFYHTHPKKDEPSLSSADDYLIYFDMSHKPRNIRHFYTVMADRMDYFHIVPKPSKKKDYVKINEDKFIAELDNQIDEAASRLDQVMSSDSYGDDLHYCEKVTREVVKWLNNKYEKYFTITYKCHYRVKNNPDKPTGDDLHLDDEFIGKALKDLKTGSASWPEFGEKDKPQENYAYWHSKYFTMNKDAKGVGYMGLLPGDTRRFNHFIYAKYRGSEYTYEDLLGILCISNDIKIRDAKIRDGKETTSRIEDILDYLEIDNEEIREDIMLYDSIVVVDAYGSMAEVVGEEHNFILPIADFSIQSVEAMNLVRSGKKNLERAKYDIMVTLKEKMGKAVANGLGKRNKQLVDTRTPVAVYGQDGPAVSTLGINPPVQRKRRDFSMVLPKNVFDNQELLLEILEPFKKPDMDLRNQRTNQYNIVVPGDNSAVGFTFYDTGNVQIFVPAAGYPMPEDPDEAVLVAVRTLIEAINNMGLATPIETADIAFGTLEPIRNPNTGVIVALVGPIQQTKNKILDSLSKRMNASVVTTFTTKTLKAYERRPNIVEVTDETFTKMETNGEIVVATQTYDGHKRGFSRKDMQKGDFMLIDAEVSDLHFLINAKPSVISFFLHPTNSEATIEGYLLQHVSPQEAKRVSRSIEPSHDQVEHTIEYDIERPASAIEEIYNAIPKPNPMPKSIGSMMVSSNGEYYLRVKSNPVENPQKKISIRIDESTNPEKKMMAVFTKSNGRTKTIHFGARGMSDYTQHKDKSRRKNYLARHGGMGEDWNDPMTAGALSRWILWGKPSLRESFNDFKKRFNMEGVMAVTNTKMNPAFIEKKNPMAPGYQSYSWTTEDWRSIKVNNKGEIDYKEKCGAEGTQTPDGSPRLCLPAEVIRSLLRTESGKDVIRTQARKKARAKKGERVPWHPRIKKIWKRVKEQSPKDNAPSFIAARDPKKWAKRYDRIIKMSGEELMEEANEQAAEKGLKIEFEISEPDIETILKSKTLSLPTKYEKLYEKYLRSRKKATISLIRGKTVVDELVFTLVEESSKELLNYLESRKRWPNKKYQRLPEVMTVVMRQGGTRITMFEHFMAAGLQRKEKFPIATGGSGGYEMTEGQQGKGYYGIIKTYQTGYLESNGIEAFGGGQSPMRSDLYQSYGWLTAYSYKDNYPYPSAAAEYYLNLNRDKLPNKDADYWNVYRPVYSGTKSNPMAPSKVIIVSGPSGSGKSTISKTIAKELGGTLVPTVTTRSRRPKEKEGGDRIFVSKDEFKEMINNNEFVEYKQHKDGVFYGRRKTDMADISIVEVSLKGMKEYKELYPDSFAVFLEPDKSPKEIEKRLLLRGGMSEANAKARASIIPKQVAAAKTMPYDLFVKSRTGKYSEVAKEIISQIPMANPGWRHGEAMDEEDDPFADQFDQE
jgi:guanylate kinase